jgi:hypothetical protein
VRPAAALTRRTGPVEKVETELKCRLSQHCFAPGRRRPSRGFLVLGRPNLRKKSRINEYKLRRDVQHLYQVASSSTRRTPSLAIHYLGLVREANSFYRNPSPDFQPYTYQQMPASFLPFSERTTKQTSVNLLLRDLGGLCLADWLLRLSSSCLFFSSRHFWFLGPFRNPLHRRIASLVRHFLFHIWPFGTAEVDGQ